MPSRNLSDYEIALGILRDLVASWNVRDNTGVEDALYRARWFLERLTLQDKEKSAKRG